MSLIKWNDKEFGFPTSITSWMDDMWGKDFFGKDVSGMMERLGRMGTSVPAVNIHETPEAYTLEFAVPGMQKEDFDIALKGRTLTISSQKKQEKEEKDEGKNTLRREFSFSSFSRSFDLPENIEADQVIAKYVEGMLQVNVPKKANQPDASGRKITID